jgi:hypothetical protein
MMLKKSHYHCLYRCHWKTSYSKIASAPWIVSSPSCCLVCSNCGFSFGGRRRYCCYLSMRNRHRHRFYSLDGFSDDPVDAPHCRRRRHGDENDLWRIPAPFDRIIIHRNPFAWNLCKTWLLLFPSSRLTLVALRDWSPVHTRSANHGEC